MPVTALKPLPTAAALRPLHVVQVSRDALLFDAERGAESRARQRAHAGELDACRPGSRMTILVIAAGPPRAPLQEDGLAVCAVPGPVRRSLGLWRALDRLHRERPIDVMTTQTVSEEAWTVLLFARWRSIRVVGQIHNDLFGERVRTVRRPRWLRALQRRLALRSLRYFHSLRVASRPLERQLYERRRHGRISTIPVVMPTLADAPPAAPASEPRRTVLFVGRLTPDKDLDRWLTVAARVAPAAPTARFEIVGEGSEAGRLRGRARALGIGDRVRFRGFIPNAALAPVYRDAAVLVVTSPSEGFGRVIAEALAHGTPVVATRSAGPEELLQHADAGFLHDRDDVDGMARSVLRLLRDHALRERMGRAGARRVRRAYDPARLRRAWITMLVEAARPPLGPLLLPRRRTFARWREIGFARYSLLRTLEYEALRGLTLRGRVLDIGGGSRNSYHHLLRLEGEIESVNVDPRVAPTYLHDLDEPLPLPDAAYDHVVSLNTFEHLYRDEVAVSEALRVLKPGGSFHVVVPFLYRVHGSPLDFTRHTAEWWTRFLAEHGVDPQHLTIEPLVWDRVGTAFSFFGSGLLGRCARPVLLLPAVLQDLWGRQERLRDRGSSRRVADYALGYLISGTK
jgi:glycosyltransferase involved in cell wall biosynthesis